jgi:hypothetical protein
VSDAIGEALPDEPTPESFVRVIPFGQVARVAFAAAYFGAQALLVATAGRRADRAFGFQMFSESSTISVHLMRRVDAMSGHDTVLVDAGAGEWSARDAYGKLHHFSWRDRVKEPALAAFDVTLHASYGADAQLARWQAALDDVAAHIPEDAETYALVAEITVRKNGREPHVVELSSALLARKSAP